METALDARRIFRYHEPNDEVMTMQFLCAPMEGVTGDLFRQAQRQTFPAADSYYTPFLSPTANRTFSPRELLARVRAVLRRAQPVQAERKEPEEDGVVRVRGLWMDRKSMKARMDGVPMDLTALEFRILFGMAAHPGRVFTRENLLELAVGREFSRYDRSVDMHISTLRRKLGDDPHNPAYLKTIRGMGYTLLPEEA